MMADERIEAAQQFATISPCDEQAGWDWLTRMAEAVSDEAPEDITYSADQMVDAFMAGRQTRPAPKADSALVVELGDGHEEKREIWKQEGYGHNALFNDFACPGEVGFDQGWLACKRKAAALSDRDVVLERLLREAREDTHVVAMIDPGFRYLGLAGERIREAGDRLARIDAALKGGVDE